MERKKREKTVYLSTVIFNKCAGCNYEGHDFKLTVKAYMVCPKCGHKYKL